MIFKILIPLLAILVYCYMRFPDSNYRKSIDRNAMWIGHTMVLFWLLFFFGKNLKALLFWGVPWLIFVLFSIRNRKNRPNIKSKQVEDADYEVLDEQED